MTSTDKVLLPKTTEAPSMFLILPSIILMERSLSVSFRSCRANVAVVAPSRNIKVDSLPSPVLFTRLSLFSSSKTSSQCFIFEPQPFTFSETFIFPCSSGTSSAIVTAMVPPASSVAESDEMFMVFCVCKGSTTTSSFTVMFRTSCALFPAVSVQS